MVSNITLKHTEIQGLFSPIPVIKPWKRGESRQAKDF